MIRSSINRRMVYFFLHTGIFLLLSDVAFSHDTNDKYKLFEVINSWQEKIDSLDISYTIQYLNGTKQENAKTYEARYTIQSPFCFRENIHYSDKVSKKYDLNHFYQYYSPEKLGAYYIKNRLYEIVPGSIGKQYQEKIRWDLFMQIIGWCPREDIELLSRPDQKFETFLSLIENNPNYTAKTESEFVDGVECRVLSTPIDILWIDINNGVILKRETYTQDGKMIRQQITRKTSRYIADQKVFVFPTEVEITTVAEQKNVPCSIKTLLSITSLTINNVDENVFNVSLAPGTLSIDRNTGKTYQTHGGLDLLDESIGLSIEINRLRDYRPTSYEYLFFLADALLLFLGCITILVLILRKNNGVEGKASFLFK